LHQRPTEQHPKAWNFLAELEPHTPALPAPFHQTEASKRLQVARRARLREPNQLGELPNASLGFSQRTDQPETGGNTETRQDLTRAAFARFRRLHCTAMHITTVD
jgi:hypothetical protein